jgi:GntR family transcriptional repressor for pyruvate dehydrogenase complex
VTVRALPDPQVPIAVEAAYRIRRLIAERKLGHGDRLPSERELAQILGVSRTSVRAALKELQATGIIEVSATRGTFVSADGSRAIVASMQGWFEANLVRLPELVEFRRAIEPPIASIAARNRTDEDLTQLQLQLETMATAAATNDAALYSGADTLFHQQIAVASRNNLFLLMTAAVGEITRTYREAAARLGPAMLKRSYEDHVVILRSLEDGDPEEAHQAMLRHIVETVVDFDIVSRDELK